MKKERENKSRIRMDVITPPPPPPTGPIAFLIVVVAAPGSTVHWVPIQACSRPRAGCARTGVVRVALCARVGAHGPRVRTCGERGRACAHMHGARAQVRTGRAQCARAVRARSACMTLRLGGGEWGRGGVGWGGVE